MLFHIPAIDLMFTSKCNMDCSYCFEGKKENQNLSFAAFKSYLDQKGTGGLNLFGGEPFLNPQFLKDIFDYLKVEKEYAKKIINVGTKKIITNGTLLQKNSDLIKKYDLTLQISVDGPREIHNTHRIMNDKSGSFDKIMENIQFCMENKLPFTLHGVVTKATLPSLYEIVIFQFEQALNHNGSKTAINQLNKNNYQIIFEDDYSDSDIDLVLEQIYQVCEYFFRHKKLTLNQKKKALANFLTRKGKICAGGSGLIAVDTNLDMFPCHRYGNTEEKKGVKLGNIFNAEEFTNYKLFNSYYNISSKWRFLYSTNFFNHSFTGDYYFFMWCPSTNIETNYERNPYHINSKYTVLIKEIGRLAKILLTHYQIGDEFIGNTRHSNRRYRNQRDNHQNRQ